MRRNNSNNTKNNNKRKHKTQQQGALSTKDGANTGLADHHFISGACFSRENRTDSPNRYRGDKKKKKLKCCTLIVAHNDCLNRKNRFT